MLYYFFYQCSLVYGKAQILVNIGGIFEKSLFNLVPYNFTNIDSNCVLVSAFKSTKPHDFNPNPHQE